MGVYYTTQEIAESTMRSVLNGDCMLCKRYTDGEEVSAQVPDIFEYLRFMQGRDEDNQSRYEKIQSIIDKVSSEEYPYYYVNGLDIAHIQLTHVPVQIPDVVGGKLVWNNTGVEALVYVVPRHGNTNSMCYIAAEDDEYPELNGRTVFFNDGRTHEYNDYKLFTTSGYVGFSNMQDVLPEVKFVKCKDCGTYIFGVSAGEQKWYADKGFTLPKRCKDCRINKH